MGSVPALKDKDLMEIEFEKIHNKGLLRRQGLF